MDCVHVFKLKEVITRAFERCGGKDRSKGLWWQKRPSKASHDVTVLGEGGGDAIWDWRMVDKCDLGRRMNAGQQSKAQPPALEAEAYVAMGLSFELELQEEEGKHWMQRQNVAMRLSFELELQEEGKKGEGQLGKLKRVKEREGQIELGLVLCVYI